jgi:ferredoxin--NADP+ reductase
MYEVVESEMIVPSIQRLTLRAPAVAATAEAGQFVILRPYEDGERIPISIADWDKESGTITVFVVDAGKTSAALADLKAGATIPTVVGPLGTPTAVETFGTVMCVGGCYGHGSIYPIVRSLKEKNNRVIAVVEAKSSFMFYWDEKLRTVSDKLIYITRDGTRGYRGHVNKLPKIIEDLDEPVDRIVINGCTMLSKAGSDASRPLGIKTVVSLNPIMIDGTGMCGVCRVTVKGETKFACVDGPDFDGHEVDWEELMQRRRSYLDEEIVVLRSSGCKRCREDSRGGE